MLSLLFFMPGDCHLQLAWHGYNLSLQREKVTTMYLSWKVAAIIALVVANRPSC